ncbi:cytochrome c oxidase accessory protein CcoG [Uliginosibacterium sp. 31-16]|uniref:cytochrome c oxidase accessory protein CcoG n=1 Tax=Uliginosibacterium sp. 31-16 TaxID=3068315 RepID=UPI0027401882|nr:cytochrome c oxidase accessory protein CcoG [Uliginosibacterium sp. 31-16]MDP5240127.1 cytochrome c oxidase accessory protein CcoG [Uliginosibacterium sp. 31-16]
MDREEKPSSDETTSSPEVSTRVVKLHPRAAGADADALYEVRQKVYPRAVSGRFAAWRWALVWLTQLVFYGLCWLPWNDRQAVLFDLAERKFYVFGWVFWPQDVFFLAILLIICAYSLFLFTAVAGRLWCGYACPQTVYTEIFIWIEKLVEGDRARRMKLDAAGASFRKILLKAVKYGAWVAVALWTGVSFVGYFSPVRELLSGLINFSAGGWEIFWILFYGGFTYLMAGVMREQVCKYMCPYARFQGVMFDPDTLVITYDEERGEPRGSRRKGVAVAGQGDCVDCGICVQVCPTGIDIRQGLQYECIGCAACIDACDQVMDKVELPRGLIRYSTENAIRKHWGRGDIIRHVLRPRILIYVTVLCAICIAFVWGLTTRKPLRMDVIKDRTVLVREVEGSLLENVYILHVMNMAEQPRHLRLGVSGIEGVTLDGQSEIEMLPAQNKTLTVRVRVPLDTLTKGAHQVFFDLQAEDDSSLRLHEKAVFIAP